MRMGEKTFKQLKDCKPNTLFLVHTKSMVKHAEDILRQLERADVRVDSLSNLEKKYYYRYAGLHLGDVILDHACYELYQITDEQYDAIQYLRCLIRSPLK